MGVVDGDIGKHAACLLHRVETLLAQLHVGRHGLELDLQAHRVAQRTVGIGEEAEEIDVLLARAGKDFAGAGQDIHLDDGLVRQAVAEARGFHAHAGHRAAQGDGLKLRNDERHEAVRQGGIDQVLVGAHALHIGGAGEGIDLDNPA